MKVLIVSLFLILSVDCHAVSDEQELLNFFQGDYDLVGVYPNSRVSYTGSATFKAEKGYLVVTRKINGRKISGRAQLETTAMAEAQVLRIRFEENNRLFEETCLFQADLDNYARISCYFYQSGKKIEQAGMEAYFIKRRKDIR